MLSNMRLTVKLPLMITIIGIGMIIASASVNYVFQSRSEMARAQAQLIANAEIQRQSITSWYNSVRDDLIMSAQNPTTSTAITWFGNAWYQMDGDPSSQLREWYIDASPYSAGERHLYDRAPETVPYNYQHGALHPYFRMLMEQRQYYDVFLFDIDGNLIYSVFKEDDFATNFVEGPHASSGLGMVFREAIAAPVGSTVFRDFEPYAPSYGALAAFGATPVADENGEVIGVLAFQMSVSNLANTLNTFTSQGTTAASSLVHSDGYQLEITEVDGSITLQSVNLEPSELVSAVTNGLENVFDETIGITGELVAAASIPLRFDGFDWNLVVEEPLSEINAPIIATRNLLFMVGGISSLVALGLGYLFGQSVTAPISRIEETMRSVAQGNYQMKVVDADRGDELGRIATVLDDFKEKLKVADASESAQRDMMDAQRQVVERLDRALNVLSDGDFTQPINQAFPDDYESLRANYNDAVDGLSKSVSKLTAAADDLGGSSDNIADATGDLSVRTETMAATLEETAAAIDELTSSVKAAADGAKSVESIVVEAKSEAAQSHEVVENAVQAMTEIEQSSNHISKIIGVIDDIAFQTNLLALNAGVEAARAGEAGRGFAVVASEVRGLAQRSSEAAKEIKSLINDSAEQVETGVKLVGQAGAALGSISERVNHISTLVSEIAAGASEQATGLAEINMGMSQLEDVTNRNTAMVDQVNSTGQTLKSTTDGLRQIVANFKVSGTAASLSGDRTDPNATTMRGDRPSVHDTETSVDETASGPEEEGGADPAVAIEQQSSSEDGTANGSASSASQTPKPALAVGAEGVWEDF